MKVRCAGELPAARSITHYIPISATIAVANLARLTYRAGNNFYQLPTVLDIKNPPLSCRKWGVCVYDLRYMLLHLFFFEEPDNGRTAALILGREKDIIVTIARVFTANFGSMYCDD